MEETASSFISMMSNVIYLQRYSRFQRNSMKKLIFGTAGVPISSPQRSTVGGIERISELGLSCMEIEFVRGVHMNAATAEIVKQTALVKNITLSVHAPYFINLNANEPAKIIASKHRLLQAARTAARCGAQNVVFHAGYYLGNSPEQALLNIRNQLAAVLEQLEAESIPVTLRPEIMGKSSQFGSLEEILHLCQLLPALAPCLDLAHWHARTRQYNNYEEWERVILQIRQELGIPALDNLHIHLSGIAYGLKGELKHLALDDSDLDYRNILKALKDYHCHGTVICESPNLEEDALLLKQNYNAIQVKLPATRDS
jgi:deoxyribonuclease-4